MKLRVKKKLTKRNNIKKYSKFHTFLLTPEGFSWFMKPIRDCTIKHFTRPYEEYPLAILLKNVNK